MFYRDTWAEIRLDHIYDNVIYLKKKTNKAIFAVVKANGYGIGDEWVAKEALLAGAQYLAVSSLDEALALRNKNITASILVLGYTNPIYAHIAIEKKIALTVTSLEWAKQVYDLKLTGLVLHIKVDTGMNRLGMNTIEDVNNCLSLLKGNQIEGIYSHYARSDEKECEFSHTQMERFKSIVMRVKHNFKWIHISNSDASIAYEDDFCNAVRCGIALLGHSHYPNDLKPVLSLYTKIVHVKEVEKESPVSYGGTYVTKDTEWIATVPIGYADGWLRSHQNTIAYINDTPIEFVGRICMDQAMLKLDQYYPVGTTVELIGKHSLIENVAKQVDTIVYEILCSLNKRIAKIYYRNEEEVAVVNSRLTHM